MSPAHRRFLSWLIILAGAVPAAGQENPLDASFPATVITGPTATGQPTAALDAAHNRSGDGVIAGRTRIGGTGGVSNYVVWAQPLRRGEPSGPPVTVASVIDTVTGAQELTRVRCAIDDAGNWVVVWDATEIGSGFLQPWARRWHAATAQLGNLIRVSPAPVPVRHEVLPDVAVGPWPGLSGSSFYVVWQEDVAQGATRIMLRRFRISVSGGSVTDVADAAVVVNSEPTAATGGQDRPAVGIDSRGTLTIVWEKYGDWGTGNPYWRIMLRRRQGNGWLQVYDPTASGAGAGGFDATDYEVSTSGDPAQNSDARFPPRVAVAADGRCVVMWKRISGAPYGLRAFTPGPGTAATPGQDHAWLPTFGSAGFGLFDTALTNEGSLVVLWESWQTPIAISGRILLSRLRVPSFATVQDVVVDPTLVSPVTGVAAAASDAGPVTTAWTRGGVAANQTLERRRLDLNLVALQVSGASRNLHLSAPGCAGLTRFLWPSVTGGDPGSYGILPLGDGRTCDLDLGDPLLQWHFATGGAPFMINAVGTLNALGTGDVPLVLPAGVTPLTVRFTLIAADFSQPFPASVRMFTQPEPTVIP